MPTSQRWVYFFGNGQADGKSDQKDLLGGKGAGLAEMTRMGLPVPAGFTITTNACDIYNQQNQQWPDGMEKQVRQMLARLERTCNKKLGDADDPLLVSVRSGAARSMPGMMETILNLGLNDESVKGLANVSGSRRFALDAYRRLIMMYGATARDIDRERFDHAFEQLKQTKTASRLGKSSTDKVEDTEVNDIELEILVTQFKEIYQEHTNETFPQDPFEQLHGAIDAVFNSWMLEKAVTYRRVENITDLRGTAVNICQMVFGNMGDDCGTGVCFTRDPSTGESIFYGDLLINAQGEDVVSGVRTPLRLDRLKDLMPDVYLQLEAVRAILEVHYHDMQDLEFTIERNKLYMLQCRTGKRSPQAAFKIAVDQATRGLMNATAAQRLVKKKYLPARYASTVTRPIITRDEAIARIEAADIERLFFPVLDPDLPKSELSQRKLGEGIGAVPGAACGEIVFTAKDAETRANTGSDVILVRKETSPEDVGGMYAAAGILTATGGKTSHAAVVARGWGKCCIVGCSRLTIDDHEKTMSLGGQTLHEGDDISIDGNTGCIYHGEINLVRPEAPPEYNTLMEWCDKRRRMKVRANADTPGDALRAIELGAEGIGLCRTEHMFFDPSEPQRLAAMREMILADTLSDRRAALDKLLPFQRDDFEGIFAAMSGLPVTIRLLDPPLHEFLPQHDNPDGQRAVVDELNRGIEKDLASCSYSDEQRKQEMDKRRITVEDIARRVEQLHESNPMLGHRGCRLCITYPEILEMQVRAIIEAAIECTKRGTKVFPEIMIPLSMDDKELSILVDRTRAVADSIINENNSKLKYVVGTMIETPRAALLAERMARVSEFFSFGTNDLTQTVMALSRDDAGRFLPDYVNNEETNIFADDPFESLDTDGVGLLMRWAVENGRKGRGDLKLGVCGEHGGDLPSIQFCEQIGLDYVSCSPFRVPIARLATARATIMYGGRSKSIKQTKSAKASKPGTVTKATVKTAGKSKPKSKTTRKTSASKKVKASASRKTTTKRKRKTSSKRKTVASRGKKSTAKRKSASAARRKTTSKSKTSTHRKTSAKSKSIMKNTSRTVRSRNKTTAHKKKAIPGVKKSKRTRPRQIVKPSIRSTAVRKTKRRQLVSA